MLRNLSSLTEELAAAARPPGPAESKKKKKTWTGWEKESGGNQREAVGNKDAGVQSGVSQSWRGKQDEEDDVSR